MGQRSDIASHGVARRTLLLAGALATSPATAQRVRSVVGEVTSLRGTATARYGAERTRTLAVPDPVRRDDLLMTGLTSRLSCRLLGRIGLQLGEASSIRLDHHVVGGPDAGSAFRVEQGVVILDRAEGPGELISIGFPWGRIQLRGTRVVAGTVGGRRTVFVARGRVDVDSDNRRYEVSEGEALDLGLIGNAVGDGAVTVVRWAGNRIAEVFALFD